MPLGLNEVGLSVQLEAAVDLLADKSEVHARRETEALEHLGQKSLETPAAPLRTELLISINRAASSPALSALKSGPGAVTGSALQRSKLFGKAGSRSSGMLNCTGRRLLG